MKTTLPSFVYGGVPGRGVQDAIGPLLQATHRQWYVGTLDLEKAFDNASPELALKVMLHMGMDRHTATLLADMWSNQRRYLQYQGETLPKMFCVDNSLPQGDCLSVAAMSYLLLPAALSIQREVPEAVHVLYADDRTFACSSARKLALINRSWKRWTGVLGLQENQSKGQYYHASVKGRRNLLACGFSPDLVKLATHVLGYSFSGFLGRKSDKYEQKRLQDSKTRPLGVPVFLVPSKDASDLPSMRSYLKLLGVGFFADPHCRT